MAQSNKRRTLQKSDVAAAIGYSDMFDFLIDIVPREESKGVGMDGTNAAGSSSAGNAGAGTSNGHTTAAAGPRNSSSGMANKGKPMRKDSHGDEEDRKRKRDDEDESS